MIAASDEPLAQQLQMYRQPSSFPSRIYLETVSTCNAQCVMCPHPLVRRDAMYLLETDVFQRCVDEIARHHEVRDVHPFNNNEPLTDRRLPKLIRYIRDRMPDVNVRIFTNGSLLTSDLAGALAESGLSAVTFSLHANTEATYHTVMKLKNFHRTCERIEFFHRLVGDRVKVKVIIVDLTLTREEAAQTKAYWADRGIEAYVSRAVNWAGNLTDESCLPTYEFEDQPSPCHRVMDEMYISASGRAILCCADWREEVVFGTVHEQTLSAIWQGPLYRHYRAMHTARTIDSLMLCNICTYARRRKRPP
jgi:molybdenum cofactor biosynthesis enzyme MoaA